MRCLEELAPHPIDTPLVNVKIIDSAALVHTLDPKRSGVVVKTFEDFSQHIFLPHIARQLQCVKRLDVVWMTSRQEVSHMHENAMVLVKLYV